MPRNSLSTSYLPRRPESAIGFPKCGISKHGKLSKMRQFNSFSFRVECTYASIRLEMSDSPPTPAAGPPTAFDIIPDILTTQRHSDSESKRVIKPNLKATPPPYMQSIIFGTHSCCTCWFCITLAACKQEPELKSTLFSHKCT